MIAATTIRTPGVNWVGIAPVISLVAAALVIIMLKAVFRRDARVFDASIAVAAAGIAASGYFLWRLWHDIHDTGAYLTLNKMVAVDGFSVFLGTVVLAAVLLVLLLSTEYLESHGIASRPEYIALLLLSAAGMLVMTTANDLIVVFVALEALSIPLYVLAAYDRNRRRSLEAGMKYFVLGAFSSAVFLYGIALVYGATGTTSLSGIATFVANVSLIDAGTLLAGLMLLLVGLGFKIAAVPFHMWTPDVYEGSPTPITAFMSSATKAAGFAALLRVLLTAFGTYRTDWRPAIWALAILTLLVGSVVALVQTDIKRMLAYSSISHAGYVLIGLEAGTRQGLRAALFYLFVYTFMTIGSFAIVMVIGRRDDRHSITEYRGARDPPASARRAPGVLPAGPGRDPADRRLHRQAGRVRVGGQQPRVRRPARALVLAPRRRRHRLGDLGVLLPAGHRVHVLVRGRCARGRGGGASVQAGDPGRHPHRRRAVRLRRADALGRDPALSDPRFRPQRAAHLLNPRARPRDLL